MLGAEMPPLPGLIPSSLPPPSSRCDPSLGLAQLWGGCSTAGLNPKSCSLGRAWALLPKYLPPPPPGEGHPLLLGTVLAFSWWHLGVLVAGGLQVSWSEEEEEEGAGLGGGTELFPRALMSPSSILPAAAMGGVMQGDTG